MKVIDTYGEDVTSGLRESEWDVVERYARTVPGWVAFKPGSPMSMMPSPAPQPIRQERPPQPASHPSATLYPKTAGAPATYATLVTDSRSKDESVMRTALPFFVLVVGLPLLLWYADRKKEKAQ